MTQLVDRTWPGCHLHFLLNILPGAEESRKRAEDSEELQVSAAEPKTPQQTERELQARRSEVCGHFDATSWTRISGDRSLNTEHQRLSFNVNLFNEERVSADTHLLPVENPSSSPDRRQKISGWTRGCDPSLNQCS